MFKDKVIDFLFNGKKYRLEKFVFLLFFWLVFGYIVIVFGISLLLMYALVLIVVLIMSLIQITWYNKKKNIRTKAIEWIGIILCLVALIVALFLYVRESKLESAAYDVIEEKVDNKNFKIEHIDELNNEENLYAIDYTVEGEDDRYLEFYYWREDEFIPENKTKGDDN